MRQIPVGLDITTVSPPVFMLSHIEVPVVPGHGSPVVPPTPASSVGHGGAVLQLVLLTTIFSPLQSSLSDHHWVSPVVTHYQLQTGL